MSEVTPLILLVDDDIDCLEVNRHFLEAAGFRVTCCFDPDEAIDAMGRERPNLIVTDLMMKLLDSGFSFSRRVKEDPRYAGIPVVVMTAVGSQLGYNFRPKSDSDLAAMHVDAFLDKPVAPQALVRKVREMLA
jgi:CheY-like chemotaxis protein